MSNIVYHDAVGNRPLLVNMLIRRKLPLHVVAKKLKMKYGSLLHQAKQLLTSKEYDLVIQNRARRTFTKEERLVIISTAQTSGVKKASRKYGVHRNQINTWMRKHASSKL